VTPEAVAHSDSSTSERLFSRDNSTNGGQDAGSEAGLSGSSTDLVLSPSSSSLFADPLSEHLGMQSEHKSEPDTFLEILLARLETFTNNSFVSNLMITGIFTQLACYPDARLSEFILHSDLLHNRYLLSLYAILSRVSQEMIKSLQRYLSFSHFDFLRGETVS
jgi:hypothetical protein